MDAKIPFSPTPQSPEETGVLIIAVGHLVQEMHFDRGTVPPNVLQCLQWILVVAKKKKKRGQKLSWTKCSDPTMALT